MGKTDGRESTHEAAVHHRLELAVADLLRALHRAVRVLLLLQAENTTKRMRMNPTKLTPVIQDS